MTLNDYSSAISDFPPESRSPPLKTTLIIPADIHEAMIAHCVREAPLEACGLLGGFVPFVSTIHPLKNELASTSRYNADPRDLIDAVQGLRTQSKEVVAIYHSHPKWAAIPSRTDLDEENGWNVPRVIVSLLGETPEVRVWRFLADSFDEIPWRITPRSV